MKRFSRAAGLVLALVFTLSLCAAPVQAADHSMTNFVKQYTYSEGTFSDVNTSQWSYSVIKACYEYGLMQGSAPGWFNCTGNLSVAEALTMADRIHQIYTTGQSTLTNGSPWYQPYVDYAISNGIINQGDFSSYTETISRADMAYVFSRALASSQLGEIRTVTAIPDVNQAPSRDQGAIWTLYRAGVLGGGDIFGTFYPNTNIARQEAAAILARMAIPAQRQSEPLLQKVSDGAVTFGMPQGGSVNKSTTSSGARMYTVDNNGIVVDVYTISDSSLSGANLVRELTAAEEKAVLEDRSSGAWFENCSVAQASFGGVQAYRTTGNYASSEYSFPMLTYRFVAGSTLYRVTVTWNDSTADRALLQQICASIAVNGNEASPSFIL